MESLTEPDQVWDAVEADRLHLADQAAAWPATAWDAPTPCDGWAVRDVVAHLVSIAATPSIRALRAYVRAGAQLDRASQALVDRTVVGRTDEELVVELRRQAASRHTPPGLRPVGVLAEVVTHLADLAVAVGEPLDLPPVHLTTTLVYLQRRTRSNTRFHLSPQGRTPVLDGAARSAGLYLRATDIGWAHDPGAPADPRDRPTAVRATVDGSAAALVLALAGRHVGPGTVAGELTGNGCVQLLSGPAAPMVPPADGPVPGAPRPDDLAPGDAPRPDHD